MESQATWKDPSNRIRLVGGLNRFAFQLFQQLCDNQPDGNLFLSPSSVATTLAMAHLGANGRTRDELASVLGYTLPEEKRREAFRELAAATRVGGVEFRSANRLWGQASYQFLEDFLQATRDDFGASLAAVDFKTDAAGACRQINEWVEEQTANRIKDAIAPECLDSLTRLVLTNAVYFLGTWHTPFEENDTREAPFFCSDGTVADVPTMYQAGDFDYAESEVLQWLQLRYKCYGTELVTREMGEETHQWMGTVEEGGSDFAMEVLLPRPGTDVDNVAGLLANDGIQGLPNLDGREVFVYLPKFRMECALSLGATLQSLGAHEAFSIDNADFSAMSDDPTGLFISEVAHKAFLQVNEEGTEAAAATVMHIGAAAVIEPHPPVELKADRPFIFLIRDTATGLVHFIGRLEDPQAE